MVVVLWSVLFRCKGLIKTITTLYNIEFKIFLENQNSFSI